MASSQQPILLGIDVGGTNTDAVLLHGSSLLSCAKAKSSNDVATGIKEAVTQLLVASSPQPFPRIDAVFLGTTALVNALLEGRGLDRVAVVRLCGPSTRSLPPFIDFPPSLKNVISAGVWFASGGLRFDGSEECRIQESELKHIASEIRQNTQAQAVVVSCTFSPSNDAQERHAARILQESLPTSIRVTISSASGQLGLLARENSAILNATLFRTAQRAAVNARSALQDAGIPASARLFFTANDGSVVSFPRAAQSPLRCVACGPTNSLRGAAFLSQILHDKPIKDDGSILPKIVLDVGGTSTDAGCLVEGRYPRDSNSEAYIAGVRCNHRTADVVSIALGGGSIVSEDGTCIGPESVGANITSEALCFGGTVCTATCVAVAMGAKITSAMSGTHQMPQSDFDVPSFAPTAWNVMQKRFYDLVESTRTDSRPMEVIVVGGGACLVDANRLSKELGCSVVIPENAAVANACGSALAQAVGEAETIADLSHGKRETVVSELKAKAMKSAGHSAQVIECEEVPLAYLPGKMTRVFVRATAPLDLSSRQEEEESCGSCWNEEETSSAKHSNELFPALRQSDPPSVVPSNPNVVNGVWSISEYDSHCLAIGCGILGCGGGGSTFHGLLQLLTALRESRPIRVVSGKSLPQNAVVAPCGFMGAPSVSLETIGGADQMLAAVRRNLELSSVDDDSSVFITCSEIGGMNGLVPLVVGGLMDRPIVDADLMGRAFPELQMTTTSIYGLPQTPMSVSDSFGRCVVITGENNESGMIPADDSYWTERVLRPVCVEFGCVAGFCDSLLKAADIRRVGILGSLSRARRIGDCVLCGKHPADSIERLLKREGGKCIFQGRVSDVERQTTAGFAKGHLTIQAEGELSMLIIEFQNEFLIARRKDKDSEIVQVVGCVPDIITLVDMDTARPVATEEVRFGFRVFVLLLPVPSLLRTPEALRVVGPNAFGLETSYVSELYGEGTPEENAFSIPGL
jgi:DUF917 family protein/N-methylhydantoinase A/oxoprolinase/acetone carboxylase beta subunit